MYISFILACKILITTGSKTTSEIVFVHKRRADQQISFAKCKPAKRFPNGNCVGAFGGVCNEKHIVGFDKDLFEYHVDKDEWTQIQNEKDVKYDRLSAQCCTLAQSLLIVSPQLGNRAELMRAHGPRDKGTNSLIVDNAIDVSSSSHNFSVDIETNKSGISTQAHSSNHLAKLPPQTFCSTLLPVTIQNSTLTSIGNNQVMLIECHPQNRTSTTLDKDLKLVKKTAKTKSPVVCIGTMVTDQNDEGKQNLVDVIWGNTAEFKSLFINIYSVSSMQRRYDYIVFKMQNSVYVTGGFSAMERPLKSCIYFDLTLMNWFTSSHSLPYYLSNASVVVDKEEKFAVITGGKKHPGEANEDSSDDIIIFTENDGFQVLKNSILLCKRSSHVSVMLS